MAGGRTPLAMFALAAMLLAHAAAAHTSFEDDSVDSGSGSSSSDHGFHTAQLPDLTGGITAVLIGLFLVGVLFMFFGYRLFKVTLFMIGFIIGSTLAWIAFYAVSVTQDAATGVVHHNENIALMVFIVLAVGVSCGACALAMFYCGIFVIGCSLGLVLGLALTYLLFTQTGNGAPEVDREKATVAKILILVLSVGGGLLALKIQKAVIIVSTSFAGAQQVVLAGVCLAGSRSFGVLNGILAVPYREVGLSALSYYVIILVLACIGIFVQMKYTGKGDHHSREPKVVVINDVGGGQQQTVVVNHMVQMPPGSNGYAPMPAQGYAPMPAHGYPPMPAQGYAPMPPAGYAHQGPAGGYAAPPPASAGPSMYEPPPAAQVVPVS